MTLSLPVGTVTFLFTDIEGSTRLWEQFPAEMGAALARHDALLREAIEHNNGAVFATGGDAFCAAFHTASAALSAALDAQLSLAREPWPEPVRIRVRMALHTGAAEVRDNDYFGQPLNRVARVLAAGHGGQVLLSLATRELVQDRLPAGLALRDLGERRLKDLIRPERIYQLVASDLPAEFPPLKTLDARAHNLPIQLTSFVGREQEMQDVKGLLGASRLVTLIGSGGAGKTRLGLQVSADLIDDFADGVWLVELAPLTDPRLVPQTMATVLGIKEQPGAAITDTLTKELRNKELLLILDNCEHLVDASARLCQSLLAICAGVHLLVTSRETLRVPGETTYRVPSLPTPDPKTTPSVASLTQYAAVRLFIDRAVAVRPEFVVSNANAPALASICHRLDGIPLALELAAARVRSLSVDDIDRRLDQRFRLLIGGSRTALPRQQTLRALIDWSYELLDASERALFGRLSVFAGGWALEVAVHVCGGEGVDASEIADLLTSLADKSLVVVEPAGTSVRYGLLETVRQYARDRLQERGEEARWQARHLACFLALAEEAAPQLMGADQQAWLERLDREIDNLRLALTRSSAPGGDAESGLRLAGALWRFWYVHGHIDEGRGQLNALLAATPDAPPAARAKALNGAGALALEQADYPAAKAMFGECLLLRRALGDRQGIAGVLGNLGSVAMQQGDPPSARALLEECLAIFRELGDRQHIATALNQLAIVSFDQGDYPVARKLHEEGLAIAREQRNRHGIATSLVNLGGVASDQGDYPAARALYEESLALFRGLADRLGIAYSLAGLGHVARREGDLSAARALLDESLAICRDLGHLISVASSMEGLADIAFATAETGRAARILGAAERLREDIGHPLTPGARPGYDSMVAEGRASVGDDAAFDRAWREGRAMATDRAIEYALRHDDAA